MPHVEICFVNAIVPIASHAFVDVIEHATYAMFGFTSINLLGVSIAP